MSVAHPSGRVEAEGAAEPSKAVRAWDLPTRLFHWCFVALIVSAYFTFHYASDPTLYWHRLNGYAIITLLLFRLLWGFVGSSTSRFSAFLTPPGHALRYGLDFLGNRPRHFLSHNPLGSILIVVMLAAVAAQGAAGLFSTDEVMAEGPLVAHASPAVVGLLSLFHSIGFWIIVGLACAHIAANLVYQFWKKDRLIESMVTGLKPALPYEDQSEAQIASPWRAVACFALAVAIVTGCVALAGASILH